MKNDATPRPWTLQDNGCNPADSDVTIWLEGPNFERIAEAVIQTENDDMLIHDSTPHRKNFELMKRAVNAHDDLLTAAKRVMEQDAPFDIQGVYFCLYCNADNPNQITEHKPDCPWEQLRAAIAKAEGRE
jgi:hypothetical protein